MAREAAVLLQGAAPEPTQTLAAVALVVTPEAAVAAVPVPVVTPGAVAVVWK